MDQTEKLNFIIDGLRRKPELIDEVFKKVALSLDDRILDETMRRTEHAIKFNRKIERQFYDMKNKHPGESLFDAIWYAFFFQRIPPDWVRYGFYSRSLAYKSYAVKTFQDAFELEPRRNFAARRKKYYLKKKIKNEVDRLHEQGQAKDRETFEIVGKKFGITGSSAEKYYQEIEKKLK